VLKNNGDIDDQVYDWNNLNGGNGWETSLGQNQILQQIQNTGPSGNQRKDTREERRRSQGGPGAPVPPSPALVRHGSKQLKVPAALTPGGGNSSGQVTPMSAAAQVGVPVNSPQSRLSQQHPYANLAAGGYDYSRPDGEDSYVGQEAYGRTSAIVPSVAAAPPALSQVRAQGDDIGVTNDTFEPEQRGFSIWKFLTCRQC